MRRCPAEIAPRRYMGNAFLAGQSGGMSDSKIKKYLNSTVGTDKEMALDKMLTEWRENTNIVSEKKEASLISKEYNFSNGYKTTSAVVTSFKLSDLGFTSAENLALYVSGLQSSGQQGRVHVFVTANYSESTEYSNLEADNVCDMLITVVQLYSNDSPGFYIEKLNNVDINTVYYIHVASSTTAKHNNCRLKSVKIMNDIPILQTVETSPISYTFTLAEDCYLAFVTSGGIKDYNNNYNGTPFYKMLLDNIQISPNEFIFVRGGQAHTVSITYHYTSNSSTYDLTAPGMFYAYYGHTSQSELSPKSVIKSIQHIVGISSDVTISPVLPAKTIVIPGGRIISPTSVCTKNAESDVVEFW